MKPTTILERALNYSSYSKGAEYSASDITAEPLMVKLRKKYPKLDDIKTIDKVKAFIGTGFHLNCSEWITKENEFNDTGIRTEHKVKYRNLSGTADIIFPDGTIGDWKTGSETNITKKIKEPKDWITQMSIYSYLLYKQENIPMQPKGYIYWVTTDTGKYGTLELKLLTKEETINIIKEFMTEMKKPIEETKQCKLCTQFLYRWCSARSKCPMFGEDKNFDDKIESW